MQDRERERLFGRLGERVAEAAFLDVFAGSGAISLEALSRGARLATLVENGRRVLPVLRRHLDALGAGPRARLLPISALGLPKSGEPGAGTVDVAVCCPPFPLLLDDVVRPRLERLFLYVRDLLLAPGGLLVLEHPARFETGRLPALGPAADVRRTAGSALSFWDRQEKPPQAP
jgi:16S rRNA (guanine966-N2)-methyltransferase